jgi:hypothetical protein
MDNLRMYSEDAWQKRGVERSHLLFMAYKKYHTIPSCDSISFAIFTVRWQVERVDNIRTGVVCLGERAGSLKIWLPILLGEGPMGKPMANPQRRPPSQWLATGHRLTPGGGRETDNTNIKNCEWYNSDIMTVYHISWAWGLRGKERDSHISRPFSSTQDGGHNFTILMKLVVRW